MEPGNERFRVGLDFRAAGQKADALEPRRRLDSERLERRWSDVDRPEFAGGARGVVRSIGGAIRANAFNLFAVELSIARTLDREDRSLQWQLGIRQGF